MADIDAIVNGLARRLYEEAGSWCEGSGLSADPWFQTNPEVRDAFKAAARALVDGAAN